MILATLRDLAKTLGCPLSTPVTITGSDETDQGVITIG